MNRFVFILLLCSLSACSRPQSPTAAETCDTIMKNYFRVMDTMEQYFLTNEERQLMRAYYKKDTQYLLKHAKRITEMFDRRKNRFKISYSALPKDLKRAGYDAAFRFEYGSAFCNQELNYTIAKKGDSTIVEVYLYEHPIEEMNDTILNYSVVQYIVKRTNHELWDSVSNEMQKLDFWGMLNENDRSGMDGSGLWVAGYISLRQYTANGYHYKNIYRWAAEHTYLGELFIKLVRESLLKDNCLILGKY